MTLNSKRDLDTVKVNPHAKCLLKPSFRAKIILETVTPRILDRSHYLDHYTQPFRPNGPLSGTTQKKHSPTHTHRDHQTAFINLFHLLRSITSSFNLRAWQSFSTTSLQVLFGLPLGTGPSTSYSYISSPNHHLLFTTHAHTIATCFSVVPRLCHLFSLSAQLITWESVFYLNATNPSDHSHLCSLKCHLIFFPYRPGLTRQLTWRNNVTTERWLTEGSRGVDIVSTLVCGSTAVVLSSGGCTVPCKNTSDRVI